MAMLMNTRMGAVTTLGRKQLPALIVRHLRGQESAYRQERIVLNEDGSMLICWHPEPKFPYEMSRPLPEQANETHPTLKTQFVNDMKELYHHKPERLVRRDLMRLTWTTKHRWFPNNEPRYDQARWLPREKPFI